MKNEICKHCGKTKEEHKLVHYVEPKKIIAHCVINNQVMLGYKFEPITNHIQTKFSNLADKIIKFPKKMSFMPKSEREVEYGESKEKVELIPVKDIKTALKQLKERKFNEYEETTKIECVSWNDIKEIFGSLADE